MRVMDLELVQKFINVVMWRGKKNAARHIVYDAIDVLTKKAGDDKRKGLRFFYKALIKLPAVEVRPRRVGGSVYQIPREVPPNRARALAMRWLISAAAERSDKTMGHRLHMSLLDAAEGRGSCVKKKLMCIEWQKQTVHSLIMHGKEVISMSISIREI